MIVIADYGTGNSGSIVNILRKLGHDSVLSAAPDEIAEAQKIILPGVGAFDTGMRRLRASGLAEAIENRTRKGIPLLGICLGMQLLTRGSEEGSEEGLGWIDARTVRFEFAPEHGKLRIPHMGWNTVERCAASPLTDALPRESRFYFVHSYYVKCANPDDVILNSTYGVKFVAAFQHDNIFGVQFHPEKSHRFGLSLLARFCSL